MFAGVNSVVTCLFFCILVFALAGLFGYLDVCVFSFWWLVALAEFVVVFAWVSAL